MDPPEKIAAFRASLIILIASKGKSSVIAASRATRDSIPFESDHLSRCQCSSQTTSALLEPSLCVLALSDIDVGADDAMCVTIIVVRYYAA